MLNVFRNSSLICILCLAFFMVLLLAQRVDMLRKLDVDKTLLEDSSEDLNNLYILEALV